MSARLVASVNWTTEETAAYCRVRTETLRDWRKKGRGPAWFRLPGSRRVLYDEAEVRRWVRQARAEGAHSPRDRAEMAEAEAEELLEQSERDLAENAALAAAIARVRALPHEDWCCAKGCAGPGFCTGCANVCRCVVSEVVAALDGVELPSVGLAVAAADLDCIAPSPSSPGARS